jgi:hypothetical protein
MVLLRTKTIHTSASSPLIASTPIAADVRLAVVLQPGSLAWKRRLEGGH